MKKLCIYPMLLASLFAGCANSKKPSESNFAAAINAYLDKKGEICTAEENWPVEVEVTNGDSYFSKFEKMDTSLANRMKALESVGVVSSKKTQASGSTAAIKAGANVVVYELSESAKPYIREAKSNFSSPKAGQQHLKLCYAKETVKKIEKWEGPIRIGEYEVANVKYYSRLVQVAPWASNATIQKAFPDIKNAVENAESKLQTHAVQLTNKGWEAKGIDG